MEGDDLLLDENSDFVDTTQDSEVPEGGVSSNSVPRRSGRKSAGGRVLGNKIFKQTTGGAKKRAASAALLSKSKREKDFEENREGVGMEGMTTSPAFSAKEIAELRQKFLTLTPTERVTYVSDLVEQRALKYDEMTCHLNNIDRLTEKEPVNVDTVGAYAVLTKEVLLKLKSAVYVSGQIDLGQAMIMESMNAENTRHIDVLRDEVGSLRALVETLQRSLVNKGVDPSVDVSDLFMVSSSEPQDPMSILARTDFLGFHIRWKCILCAMIWHKGLVVGDVALQEQAMQMNNSFIEFEPAAVQTMGKCWAEWRTESWKLYFDDGEIDRTNTWYDKSISDDTAKMRATPAYKSLVAVLNMVVKGNKGFAMYLKLTDAKHIVNASKSHRFLGNGYNKTNFDGVSMPLDKTDLNMYGLVLEEIRASPEFANLSFTPDEQDAYSAEFVAFEHDRLWSVGPKLEGHRIRAKAIYTANQFTYEHVDRKKKKGKSSSGAAGLAAVVAPAVDDAVDMENEVIQRYHLDFEDNPLRQWGGHVVKVAESYTPQVLGDRCPAAINATRMALVVDARGGTKNWDDKVFVDNLGWVTIKRLLRTFQIDPDIWHPYIARDARRPIKWHEPEWARSVMPSNHFSDRFARDDDQGIDRTGHKLGWLGVPFDHTPLRVWLLGDSTAMSIRAPLKEVLRNSVVHTEASRLQDTVTISDISECYGGCRIASLTAASILMDFREVGVIMHKSVLNFVDTVFSIVKTGNKESVEKFVFNVYVALIHLRMALFQMGLPQIPIVACYTQPFFPAQDGIAHNVYAETILMRIGRDIESALAKICKNIPGVFVTQPINYLLRNRKTVMPHLVEVTPVGLYEGIVSVDGIHLTRYGESFFGRLLARDCVMALDDYGAPNAERWKAKYARTGPDPYSADISALSERLLRAWEETIAAVRAAFREGRTQAELAARHRSVEPTAAERAQLAADPSGEEATNSRIIMPVLHGLPRQPEHLAIAERVRIVGAACEVAAHQAARQAKPRKGTGGTTTVPIPGKGR